MIRLALVLVIWLLGGVSTFKVALRGRRAAALADDERRSALYLTLVIWPLILFLATAIAFATPDRRGERP